MADRLADRGDDPRQGGGRAGGAEDQRHAIHQKAGGESAQQEVFEGGFFRARGAARAKPASTYSGMESSSSARKTTIRSAAIAISIMPEMREQQQDVIFAALDPHALQIIVRQGDRQPAR